MADAKTYEGAQSFVFLVGIYEGLLPLICKPLGWQPLLALPARWPSPWWWIVSTVVIVVAVVLLEVLDRAKKRVEED